MGARVRRGTAGLVSASMLLVLAACGGAGGGDQAGQRPAAEVGVVTLKTEPVTLTAELTGRASPTAIAEVRPQVAGIIRKRLFEEGSFVRAGQPLYQIDARIYEATRDQTAAQLANAQAALATAQAKAERYERLTQVDAVSQQDIDDAVAAARQASANVAQYKAALRTAQVNLGFTNVAAPISGRIGRSAFTQGALVTANQEGALTTIQQLDPIFVDIQQSSQDLLNLRESLASGDVLPASTKVRLVLENGRAYPQEGTLEFSEVTVDPNAGTVTLRARFPNPEGLLLPGMFVRVLLPEAVVGNGILVPQQAVSRDAKGNATVLIVDKENKVVQKSVSAAKAIGDKWLVTSGLSAGDRVIVEGTAKVRPGAAVRPVAVTIAAESGAAK